MGCCRRTAPRRGDSTEDRGGATETAGANRRRGKQQSSGQETESRGATRSSKQGHQQQGRQRTTPSSRQANTDQRHGTTEEQHSRQADQQRRTTAAEDEATTMAWWGMEDHRRRGDSSTGMDDSCSTAGQRIHWRDGTAGATSGGMATGQRQRATWGGRYLWASHLYMAYLLRLTHPLPPPPIYRFPEFSGISCGKYLFYP